MGLPRRNPLLDATLTAAIDTVAFGKWRYRLREPIEVNVYQDGGFWFHEFTPLEICAHGRTREESAEAFSEHFSSIWHWIAQSDDKDLGSEAIDLKRKMLRLVKAVETAG